MTPIHQSRHSPLARWGTLRRAWATSQPARPLLTAGAAYRRSVQSGPVRLSSGQTRSQVSDDSLLARSLARSRDSRFACGCRNARDCGRHVNVPSIYALFLRRRRRRSPHSRCRRGGGSSLWAGRHQWMRSSALTGRRRSVQSAYCNIYLANFAVFLWRIYYLCHGW